jgi:hypothetical protein
MGNKSLVMVVGDMVKILKMTRQDFYYIISFFFSLKVENGHKSQLSEAQ